MITRVPNINEFNIRFVEPTDDENIFIGYCTNTNVLFTTTDCYADNGGFDSERITLTIDYYNGIAGNLNAIYLNAIDYIGLDKFDVPSNISTDYVDIYQVFLYKDRTIKKVINTDSLCVWDDLTYYFKYNIFSNDNIKKQLFDCKVVDGVKDGFKEFI